ncbi:peptide ligase PGM1-related protein [Streptomyces sp. NPDC048254]|uniref:peptide ligase PGM1-related protein n=1 Tax=Streptomyces sp. NPDC048254 TaxID=3365525 RepID=UPI0037154CE6
MRSPEFHRLLLLLDGEALHFRREQGAGIIITQDNTTETGTVEYIAIGRTRDEAAAYERRLEDILQISV